MGFSCNLFRKPIHWTWQSGQSLNPPHDHSWSPWPIWKHVETYHPNSYQWSSILIHNNSTWFWPFSLIKSHLKFSKSYKAPFKLNYIQTLYEIILNPCFHTHTHIYIYIYIIYFRPENFPSKSHPIPHRPDFQDLHFEEIPSSLQPGRRDYIAKWPVAVRLQNKKGNNRIADVEIFLSSLISIQIYTYIYINMYWNVTTFNALYKYSYIGMWRRCQCVSGF